MKIPRWVRPILDLLLTVDFIIEALSGIALYLAPSGKIAEITKWTFLGLNRSVWEALHIYFGFAMIALVAIHLFVNWNAMICLLRGMIKNRKTNKISVKNVLGIAIVNLLLIGGAVIYSIKSLESESDYYTSSEYETISNTTEEIEVTGSMLETFTIEELAQTYNISADRLIEILEKDYGIKTSKDEFLEVVMANNGYARGDFKYILEEAILKAKED